MGNQPAAFFSGMDFEQFDAKHTAATPAPNR
jgi:hypothetical protein